jgi:hypothetical protein
LPSRVGKGVRFSPPHAANTVAATSPATEFFIAASLLGLKTRRILDGENDKLVNRATVRGPGFNAYFFLASEAS